MLGPWIKVNLDMIKQEMLRVNINILISELKWTEMSRFNSDGHYIYYWGQESLRRNGVILKANKRAWNTVLGYNLKNSRVSSDAKAEASIIWPPDEKSQLIGKDPDAGTDWGQEEKGVTRDEIVGWHNWLNRHEFEQTPGDSEGQQSLVYCSPWGLLELDTT